MKYKIRPLKALFLAIVLLWTLFPIYWMLSLSIRSNAELTAKLSILPHSFTFSHFVSLFKFKHIGNSIVNSLQVALVSLAIAVCAGVPCAYIFSRARFAFRLKKAGILWVLLLRVLPPIAFAIPLYVMMNRIGLLGTKIPIVLSHILLNYYLVLGKLFCEPAERIGRKRENRRCGRMDGFFENYFTAYSSRSRSRTDFNLYDFMERISVRRYFRTKIGSLYRPPYIGYFKQ